jgi:hypothetical protein
VPPSAAQAAKPKQNMKRKVTGKITDRSLLTTVPQGPGTNTFAPIRQPFACLFAVRSANERLERQAKAPVAFRVNKSTNAVLRPAAQDFLRRERTRSAGVPPGWHVSAAHILTEPQRSVARPRNRRFVMSTTRPTELAREGQGDIALTTRVPHPLAPSFGGVRVGSR